MNDSFDPSAMLGSLLDLPAETEVVEFKEAKNGYDFRKLGKYFSALCNEANLKRKDAAWLVFGVANDHRIVGSQFRPQRPDLDSLKEEVGNKTTSRITFTEIYEVHRDGKRVVMLEIPPAPQATPVAFEGHFYARDGESLQALNPVEYERIRAQSTVDDWSAVTIPEATLADLDEAALRQARANYIAKFPEQRSEVESWDDAKFLSKAKLTINGKLTRAAILLLGNAEADHWVRPASPIIRWILKDAKGVERDYELFSLPLLLAVDRVFAKIRILKIRYMRRGTIFPVEVDQYDAYSIRESINNAIAHQDYTLGGRINVIEFDDRLLFGNVGSFLPGDVHRVVIEDAPQQVYRNECLVRAMFNLKMVDTIGGGIRKMFIAQTKRSFPLPDYRLKDDRVEVTFPGKILDMKYTELLLAKQDELSLDEIMLLDRVQKGQSIDDEEAKALRSRKLIEGRKPNYYVARSVADLTDKRAEYTKNRALDKQYYLDLICAAIDQHESVSRKDLDELLWSKLPEWMTDDQRKNKIGNLIRELRASEKIRNEGSAKRPKWVRGSA
jgi:ATP-dependent DNA helicase RecG